jgi:hypothetical protein
MGEQREILAAEGTAPNGEVWKLVYGPEGVGGRHHIALFVNGDIRDSGSGFEIPEVTEIGFGGGLTPGEGNYYLYGVVTARTQIVRAESADSKRGSEVMTAALPGAVANDGTALRTFVSEGTCCDPRHESHVAWRHDSGPTNSGR